MIDEQENVKPELSTGTEDQDVNTPQESSPEQVPQEPQTEETPSTQEVKPEVTDSRPVKNVEWEVKRKLDEVIPTLQKEIQDLKQHLQGEQKSQQPQYSKPQLLAYASEPTTTSENKLWAYSEVDRLEKAERMKEHQDIMRSTQERSDAETKRSQATQWVIKAFPDMVMQDGFGNNMGWNQAHPVLVKAGEYMARSKTLQSDPEGFAAAVKMAAFDLGVNVNKQLSKKINRTTAQLRKEQKKQLVSGGGAGLPENAETLSKNRLKKLQAEYSKTGKKEVFAEIVKLKGLNPFI